MAVSWRSHGGPIGGPLGAPWRPPWRPPGGLLGDGLLAVSWRVTLAVALAVSWRSDCFLALGAAVWRPTTGDVGGARWVINSMLSIEHLI